MTHKKLSILLIFLSSSIFSTVYATVGGGQTIELLGYEPREQKVYLLRHFEDARGRLPQLYYYDFKNQSSHEITEVKSLYLDPKSGEPDYDGNEVQFNRELKKITHRLKPLFPINPNILHVNVEKMEQMTVPSWDDPQQSVPEYRYKYIIQDKSHQSLTQQAVSYKTGLTIKQAYRIPRQNIIISTVEYLAFPEETGYTTEDPILLLPR